MPEITPEDKCLSMREDYITFKSKIFKTRKKYPDFHKSISDGVCFGLALSWGIYFLEHIAKDEKAFQLYKDVHELEKFFNYAFIAQRDYIFMKEAFGLKGTKLIIQRLNKQEEIVRRTPSYTLSYQCIDAKKATSIANSMLRNGMGSKHQVLIFCTTLERELNKNVGYVGHAATLANYGKGCLFYDLNGGIYRLDKSQKFNADDLIKRMINNISCLRDSDLSRNPYTMLESKDHILITLKAKHFNHELREEQADKNHKPAEYKIPRFKFG